MGSLNEEIATLKDALLSVDRIGVRQLLRQVVQSHTPADSEKALIQAFEEIGEDWESGDVALSQLYMAGRICEEMVAETAPQHRSPKKSHPKMGIAVLEDFHGLGKRIVQSALIASGYEVMDLGLGATVEGLEQRVQKEKVEILLISVLMLPSALAVKDLIERFAKGNQKVRVLVGGAPFRFDPDLCREIGADGTARTASEVVQLIETLIQEIK